MINIIPNSMSVNPQTNYLVKFLRTFVIIFVMLLWANLGWGQILTFEFSALGGSEATAASNSNDANLSSSTISRGAGLTAAANGGRYNATSWALTSIANSVSGNDYMQFTITPNSGYQFSVSSITISLQRSATGPRGIALRNSLDSYASNLDAEKSITDNTTTQSFTFTFSQSNSTSAVTYRIYMWAEDVAGSGGPGDFTGNDIIVNGSVTSTGGGNDADSQVSTGAGSEPATVASTVDTDGERVLVFDVNFSDLSTADALATIIDQIVFTPGSANEVADWTDAIAGAKLCGNDLTCGSADLVGTVGATSITFSGADFISIADGTNETYQLKIWLNTDLSGITDNDILEFALDYSDITCDATGSSFGSGAPESGDANCVIDIDATQLIFTSSTPPATGAPSTNFSVEISAVDANNNVDLDATNSVTLTGVSGSGTLSSATGLTQSLVNGVYEWTDCQFDDADTYQITATTSGLADNNVTSGDVVIAISADYIIISEMCDPTNNIVNRYIEIYNPTSSTIDLTGCKVEAWANGVLYFTWNLSGTIASCTALTVGNTGTIGYTPDFASAWTVTNWNGGATDGAKFKNSSGTVIDNALTVTTTFSDGSLVRNTGISSPNTTFTSSEWTYTGVTDAGLGASTPGTHICNTCGNDYDSEASAPATPVGASNISSLADTDGEAVNVFRFDIDDLGSGDGVNTKVTNIRIKPAGSNTADWTNHIQGIKLNNGSPVTIGSPTITDTYIDIPITSGNLEVTDGGSSTITMSIYLNTSNIVDGAVLSFMIDADSHYFTADLLGSTFATTFTGGDVTSNNFTVAVVATQLLFVQQPTNTVVSLAMSPNPTVKACDANGNIDTGYSTAITVSSDGTMTGDPVSGSWSSGVATFSSLTHTATATGLTLTATSAALTVNSSTFDITAVPSIYFSELAGYGSVSDTYDDEYIELTNSGASTQNLNGWQLFYYENDALEKTITFGASDEITAGSAFVIAVRTSYVSISPDYVPATGFSMNNTNFYVILKDASSVVMDEAGMASDDFDQDYNYEFTDCGTDNKPTANWDDLGETDGTPGVVNCACTPPTQATSITITKLSATSVQVDWTTGDGDNAIVVIHEEAPINSDPVNGTSYTANDEYGGTPAADEIGTGNFVVYNGTGTSVTVTALTADLTYYFAIYEYNSADECYNKTELSGSINLCSNVTIPYTQGFNAATIPSCWSSEIVADPGDMGTGLTFVATSTNPTVTPSEGTQFVKFNSYTADDGAEIRLISPPITTTGISSLNMDFDWFESPEFSTMLEEGVTIQYSLNGSSWTDIQFYQRYNAVNGWKTKTCPLPSAINNQANVYIGFLFHSQYGNNCDMDNVYIYTCTEPTSNPTTLSFSNITSSTMDLTIGTPGDGTNRIIVAREGAAVSFTPTDLTTYEASAVFTDATDLGSGNKVVYNGTGTSVSLSGLSGSTTYYFKVFEYNCVTGYENYYLGGTILSGSATTLISPVTNLEVVCQTNTTAEISWTAPIGDYTGVIIGVRNSTLVAHAISDDAEDYTADANFEDGTQYGSTTPYSFVVYKGTGTSVTVTGLTAGQAYQIKAYAYKNESGSTWSATQPTTGITSLSTANVTGNFVLTGNAELQLQWSNPGSTCFDEVMIVGNHGAAITTQPTGDGSAYTASTVFGSGDAYGTGYVVYKGSFSPQTITNLTNGEEYCFTWFTRNGTTWSSGVSECGTPAAVTILEPGDLAIVAVNTQATSSGSADEICFFAFEDITEGTSIDFTDNGYERLYEGLWASSEGTLRMTRDVGAGTVTAGKVICFQGMGYTDAAFEVFTCGDEDSDNWTITSLNFVGSTNGSYDLNVDDQIWIIQGGAWDNDGSLSTHSATYSGNVLYGWTATGWFDDPGYDDTHGSTLYPETECFNTNVAVAANHSKVKYIGATTTTSQFAWLGRINDNANWLGYVDNTAYYAARDYTGTCFEFISDEDISGTPGVWTGADNTDWFDCGNWQNLRIPRGSQNVSATGALSNHIAIDNGIASMPEAECNDLTISADATVSGAPIQLSVNHPDAVLNVYGNFTNNQIVQHTNGEIHYQGDFTNNDTYTHNTAGTAIFDGSGTQELTGTATFYNMQMNNSSSGLTLNNDITVNNVLTLTDGLINTGANKVVIENNATSAVTAHSTASYINGNLRRKVAVTGSYDLPVGTNENYEIANVNLVTSTITYIDAKFTNPHSGTILPTTPYLTVDGTDVTTMLNYGFWTMTPVAGGSTNYDVTVTSRGHTNGGSLATQHTVVKRANDAVAWDTYEDNHDNATQAGTGSSAITAKLTGMNGFSDFAIARSTTNPLPVELIFFRATLENKNVMLSWTTASEINNDYFTIEKSTDGFNFIEFNKVSGAGNSTTMNEYSDVDENPYSGLSYYRLKQTDYDGKYSYSNIVSILNNETEALSITSAYSYEQSLSISVYNPAKESLNIRITDMTGRIIYADKLNSKSDKILVNISQGQLSSGIYNLILYNNNEAVSQRILVQ
ncbi:MAG: hypothetical protein A2W98_15430 [Bacteroidetes bacterium GWF2_33_38]|nr:MAG: hypothetical protein A2W98_15430 [Bacteroidetes bacterium GWF2_33_38]